MRRVLKKGISLEGTLEIDEYFENQKKEIKEAPCSGSFDPKEDTFITTDACNTGLGATLWQKECMYFLPVAFASRV